MQRIQPSMFFQSLTGNRVFSFPLALKENAVEPLTMDPSLLRTVPLAPKCLTHVFSCEMRRPGSIAFTNEVEVGTQNTNDVIYINTLEIYFKPSRVILNAF